MIARILAITAMLICLAACGSVSRPTWLHDLSPSEVQATKDIVSAYLVDPRSAHWSHMTAVRREANGSVTVCGMVNAKTVHGGYTGMTPYRVLLKGGASRLISLAAALGIWGSATHRQCIPYVGD